MIMGNYKYCIAGKAGMELKLVAWRLVLVLLNLNVYFFYIKTHGSESRGQVK